MTAGYIPGGGAAFDVFFKNPVQYAEQMRTSDRFFRSQFQNYRDLTARLLEEN
jgi:hypothetical protein